MLRGSTAESNTDLSMIREGAEKDDGTVPQAAELIALAEAVHARDTGAVKSAGAVLSEALGPEALVDAAAVCAQFDAITRVADATGIQLDKGLEAMSEAVREDLGLNAFNTTVEIP